MPRGERGIRRTEGHIEDAGRYASNHRSETRQDNQLYSVWDLSQQPTVSVHVNRPLWDIHGDLLLRDHLMITERMDQSFVVAGHVIRAVMDISASRHYPSVFGKSRPYAGDSRTTMSSGSNGMIPSRRCI